MERTRYRIEIGRYGLEAITDPNGSWEYHADAQATVEALQKKYDDLLGKYRQLMDFYDKHNGTPCEQIRHEQQVEALQAIIKQMGEQAAVLAKDGMAAKAQVEALQRERDEAITAHRNMVKQFDELTCFIGCDYDPETEAWVSGKPPYLSAGTDEVEACKAAVAALRSVAIVLQTALDAEREKVKGLHEITKVICTHCCEPMEIASKAVLQTQLTQLQALVRAISETMEPFRKSLAKLDEVDTLATRRIAEADAYYCAQRVLATLDATTPAPKGGDGE